MNKKVLTVTLNPAIDKTVTVPNFKTGRDFREQALFLSAGGKGINVSRVLKFLGTPTIATGFIGGSDGDYITMRLDKERIKHDFCFIGENTRTSLTIIDPSHNTITRILERGPSITRFELNKFKRKFFKLTRQCRVVIFSGRNIPGAPDYFYEELIEIAKKNNIFTVFDTSGKPYELGLQAKPSMIKPNLKEAEQLLYRKIFLLSEAKQAVYQLHKRGIPLVALTMGSRGAIVSNGKEMIQAIPPKIKRKSPVGCGDAFIGGFIASYVRNKSLGESVRMAVSCGAANALSINPGFINKTKVKKLFKQVKIQNLKF